jgi:hypothetical protein
MGDVPEKNSNRKIAPHPHPGIQHKGTPATLGKTGRFHSHAKVERIQNLLVWVANFTNCVELFPCRTKNAADIVKVLVSEIIPRFELPRNLQSDILYVPLKQLSPKKFLRH